MINPPLYRIENLNHRYGDTFSLNIPFLCIEQGSSVGLIGPNGSGKSTLLRILAFLEIPNSGALYFKGLPSSGIAAPQTSGVTMLLQDPYLLKRSVFENVAFGLKVRKKNHGLMERVYESLHLVGLNPKKFVRRRWYELSGGESKRIALASRIILNPDVLILDEPTANIDPNSAYVIKEAILSIRKRFGTSLIIVSHDHVWLNKITDTNIEIYDGRISESGVDNLIPGPWNHSDKGLCEKTLQDDQKLYSVNPPDENSTAILDPTNIILSTEYPDGMSAQNIVRGVITALNMEKEREKVRVSVDIAGMPLTCSVTQYAASTLALFPGNYIWVVFKASSLHWH